MKPGKSYWCHGIELYVHDPEKPLILMYRTKEFIVVSKNSSLRISIHPYSTTNKRFLQCIQDKINHGDKIVTPGGRTISSQGKIIRNKTEFIYFIFNQDSNAIKIGKAKNIAKRLKALQSATPAKLKILKIIDVKAGKEARKIEKSFHSQFKHLKLIGEWFKYETELRYFIEQ